VGKNETRTDRLSARVKDHPIFFIIIVIFIAVTGVAEFKDAIVNLYGSIDNPKPVKASDQKKDNILTSNKISSAPLSPATEKTEIINRLLAKADLSLGALLLTSPKETSAFTYYSKVLEVDPANEGALAGIDKIARTYIALAKSSASKKDFAKVKRYLALAQKLNPRLSNSEEIKTIERETAELSEPRLSELKTGNTSPIRNLELEYDAVGRLAAAVSVIDTDAYARLSLEEGVLNIGFLVSGKDIAKLMSAAKISSDAYASLALVSIVNNVSGPIDGHDFVLILDAADISSVGYLKNVLDTYAPILKYPLPSKVTKSVLNRFHSDSYKSYLLSLFQKSKLESKYK